MRDEADITILLQRAARGDDIAREQVLPVVYRQLRQIAAMHLRREPDARTLQPTALVHEAYLRLVNANVAEWRDRAHFFALASRLMRNVLVDYARAKKAVKRGAEMVRQEVEEYAAGDFDLDRVLVVDAALKELSALSSRQGQVVEMRFFAGLSEQEIAAVMNISRRTVKRDWAMAKAWLRDRLNPPV